MAHEVLKTLGDEYTELQHTIDNTEKIASEQGRELTQSDIDLVKRTQTRQKDIASQIDVLSEQVELSDMAKRRLQQLSGGGVGSPAGQIEYRSIGHYVTDLIKSMTAPTQNQQLEARQRLETFNRVAQHVTTAEFVGAIPEVVLGPTLSFIDASRPLVSSIGVRPVPGGPTFRRPKIVDPNLATGVAVQTAEKSELVSEKFSFSSDVVQMDSLGGYINLARQVVDWGIASVQTIVDELAARYAYAVERQALAELSLSAGHQPLAAGADSATTIRAIYTAAADYYTATGEMPTTLATGPLGWAGLGSLSDSAGRQVLPFLAPANAAGSMAANSFAGNPVGLGLVVTPAITTTDLWLIGPKALEVYEQVVGQLSVVEPSVLGVQISYSGYVGYYRPAPDGAIRIGV